MFLFFRYTLSKVVSSKLNGQSFRSMGLFFRPAGREKKKLVALLWSWANRPTVISHIVGLMANRRWKDFCFIFELPFQSIWLLSWVELSWEETGINHSLLATLKKSATITTNFSLIQFDHRSKMDSWMNHSANLLPLTSKNDHELMKLPKFYVFNSAVKFNFGSHS